MLLICYVCKYIPTYLHTYVHMYMAIIMYWGSLVSRLHPPAFKSQSFSLCDLKAGGRSLGTRLVLGSVCRVW